MKWSEALTKTDIDSGLFEDYELSPNEKPLFADLQELCREPVDQMDRVKAIRTAVKSIASDKTLSRNGKELLSAIKEELAEIASDLRFAKSRRGRFVLFVQDHMQALYRTLHADTRFNDIYVGPHVEREVVMVAGTVQSQKDFASLKDMIAAHPSELATEYKITIRECA